MQSQQSIEPRQSWESVLFFSHCGTLGDFISNSPPAFGFYLCQVNWTEERGGKLEPSIFGSFRPPSKPFALRRLKHIPIPFYLPYPFLLVFPLSSHELIFIWCCVTLWWLRCTSLRPLFERDGAGFIWPDSWLCSRVRTCYDEVQWQSWEISLCPVFRRVHRWIHIEPLLWLRLHVYGWIKCGVFTQDIMTIFTETKISRFVVLFSHLLLITFLWWSLLIN